MKKLLIILFISQSFIALSQSIQPQVINSAGGHHTIGTSGITITDNVGEPFIQTVNSSNFIITQGFLQPDIVSKAGPLVSLIKNDVSCSDKKDGNISIAVSNIPQNFYIEYIWSPSTVCPGNDCSSLDSLNAGTYSVTVVIKDLSTNKIDSVKPAPVTINDINGPCLVKIFNGVTPNGDGENDIWTIENINEFPENRVTIYNRWGVKIFETKGYNNENNSWPPKNSNLQSSTYFYVIILGNGSPAIKGWVELITN